MEAWPRLVRNLLLLALAAALTGCMRFTRTTDATGKDGTQKHTQTGLTAISASGAGDALSAAGEAASTASTFLPPPWNMLVGSAGGLLAGIGGGLFHKRASDSAYDQGRADSKSSSPVVVQWPGVQPVAAAVPVPPQPPPAGVTG